MMLSGPLCAICIILPPYMPLKAFSLPPMHLGQQPKAGYRGPGRTHCGHDHPRAVPGLPTLPAAGVPEATFVLDGYIKIGGLYCCMVLSITPHLPRLGCHFMQVPTMWDRRVMISCVMFLPSKSESEFDTLNLHFQESERIQASAQSKEEMLRQLKDLVDYETREAADLQVREAYWVLLFMFCGDEFDLC